jgi:transposase InsO family protein
MKTYKQFGLPDKMLSDRGPQFVAKAFREKLSRLGVNPVLSTAYHPQTDGTMECINQEREAYLAIYCHSHRRKIWQHWSSCTTTKDTLINQRHHLK